jgi:hypothetical protein
VLKVKSKGRDFDLGRAWLENGGNVYPGAEANLALLAESAASYGFFNTNPDPDGTLRRALLIVRYGDQDFFPSLAMQTLREYEKIPDQEIAAYISENGLERIQFGRHNLRPWHDGSVLINYAGPYHTYQHYSMWDILRGAVPPDTSCWWAAPPLASAICAARRLKSRMPATWGSRYTPTSSITFCTATRRDAVPSRAACRRK